MMSDINNLELPLKTLLVNNWDLENDLAVDKILFHFNKRRVEGALSDVNIIIHEEADTDTWTNEGSGDCRAVVTVEIRLPCSGTINEAVEAAKAQKTQLVSEIYRILIESSKIKNTITRPDGWEWAYPTRRENKDNFDAPQIMLGSEIQVTIAYQR